MFLWSLALRLLKIFVGGIQVELSLSNHKGGHHGMAVTRVMILIDRSKFNEVNCLEDEGYPHK